MNEHQSPTHPPAPVYVPPEEYNEHPEYFEMLAGWHRDLPAFRKRMTNILGVMAPYLEGARAVLDFGCAAGATAIEVAKGHPDLDVLGMDYSETALEFARENARYFQCGKNLRFQQGDEATLEKLPAGGFDVVVLADIIEHVQDGVVLLQRARRLLRESGVIVLETPNIETGFPPQLADLNRFLLTRGLRPEGLLTVVPEDIDWAEKYHVNMYDREKLERETAEAGLRIRERRYPNWWLRPNALQTLFARIAYQHPRLVEKWYRHLGTDFLYVLEREDSPRPAPAEEADGDPPAELTESLELLLNLNRQIARHERQQEGLVRDLLERSFVEEAPELLGPGSAWQVYLPGHEVLRFDPGQWQELGEAESWRVKSFGNPTAVLGMEATFTEARLLFYRHAWSGFVEVRVDDGPPVTLDLYAPPEESPAHVALRLGPLEQGPHRIEVNGLGRKSERSEGAEVILEAVALRDANVAGSALARPQARVVGRLLGDGGETAGDGSVSVVESSLPAVNLTPETVWEERPAAVPGTRLFLSGSPGAELSWTASGHSTIRLAALPGGGRVALLRDGRELEIRDLDSPAPVVQKVVSGTVTDGPSRHTLRLMPGEDGAAGGTVWVEIHPTRVAGGLEDGATGFRRS